MFEPKIITDISMLPKSIETNLEELEPVIAEKCELANSLVVSPDSLEDCDHADADAAMLTKLCDRIKRFRLDWTASWQSPFEGVIAKCKDYERRLADAAKNLREKSAVGKDKIKAAKCDGYRQDWEGKIIEAIPRDFCGAPWFSLFFAERTDAKTKGNWLNKTAKPDAVRGEMDAELERCVTAIDTAAKMYTGESAGLRAVAEKALAMRFEIADAVEAVNAYREQQRMVAEAEARAKEAREAAQPIAPQKPVEQKPVSQPKEEPPRVLSGEGRPLETYRLAITGTREALIALRKWGEEHGIQFKNLDR